jgi:hypothetical protein
VLLFPWGILFLSNVRINYILEEKYSSTIYALTFRAQKIRHVLRRYIPLLECIYEVHLTGIVTLTLDRNYVEWRWYSRPFLDGLEYLHPCLLSRPSMVWRAAWGCGESHRGHANRQNLSGHAQKRPLHIILLCPCILSACVDSVDCSCFYWESGLHVVVVGVYNEWRILCIARYWILLRISAKMEGWRVTFEG